MGNQGSSERREMIGLDQESGQASLYTPAGEMEGRSMAVAAPTELQFTARPSAMDLALASAELARRSTIVIVLGTSMVVMPLPALWLGAPFGAWAAFGLLLGAAFLTGLIAVPFVLVAARRRPDLLLAGYEVHANADGLDLKSPTASTHVQWSAYRYTIESGRAFYLQTGVGPTTLIPRAGIDEGTARAFAGLLREKGLRPKPSTPMDMAIRVAFGVVLGLVPFLLGSSGILG
jgi:hypothetical protein